MRKIKFSALYSILAIGMLILSVMPMVMGDLITGNGISPNINVDTEDFPPLVWMCDSRVVYDDATHPGRISPDGTTLVERVNNYAFEGEQVQWTVLVMDKNGIGDVKDVVGTADTKQGKDGNIEVRCVETIRPSGANVPGGNLPASCNARIGEEVLKNFNSAVMSYYTCTFTVEAPGESNNDMYGEYWLTVEAIDSEDNSGTMAENEYWFLNPVVALGIDGDISFNNARPGADSYSDSLVISNDATPGSGVMMDMFISGTDFYDSSYSPGALCPTSNQLTLDHFRYYASNGAYSTSSPYGVSYTGPTADAEGYKGIIYGIGFNDPNPFYNKAEIIPVQQIGPYYTVNTLAPGAHMAITFKLSLPEPCNGDFDSGSIYFWGEAI